MSDQPETQNKTERITLREQLAYHGLLVVGVIGGVMMIGALSDNNVSGAGMLGIVAALSFGFVHIAANIKSR